MKHADTPLSSDAPHELIDIPPAFDDEPAETVTSKQTTATNTPTTAKATTSSFANLQTTSVRRLQTASPSTLLATVIGVTIVIGLLGFVAGVHFQKERGESSFSAANASSTMMGQNSPTTIGQNRFRGGRRGSLNGSFGSVTAISASSISVQDMRSGSVKTYSISSSTTIISAGAAASTSNIAVGDNVIVSAASATSTTATRIIVNGGMGGPSGSGSGAAPTDQTQNTPIGSGISGPDDFNSGNSTPVPSNT